MLTHWSMPLYGTTATSLASDSEPSAGMPGQAMHTRSNRLPPTWPKFSSEDHSRPVPSVPIRAYRPVGFHDNWRSERRILRPDRGSVLVAERDPPASREGAGSPSMDAYNPDRQLQMAASRTSSSTRGERHERTSPARETCTSLAGGRDDDISYRFGQGQTVLTSGHRRGNSVALVLIRPRRHAS